MAGAIDLFAGSKSLTGTNLFHVDKNPLNQLFEGIDDVIGQEARSLGGNMLLYIEQYVQAIAQQIINVIVGIPAELLSSLAPPMVGAFQDLASFSTSLQSNVSSALADLEALITGVGGTVIGDVVNKLEHLGTTGLYDASAGFGNLSTSLLKNLTASGPDLGQFDPSQIGAGALNSGVTLAHTAITDWSTATATAISDASVALAQVTGLAGYLSGIDSATGNFTGTVTGAIGTGATIAGQLASQVQADASSAVAQIGDATTAIESGATAATTDFGQAVQGMLGNLVQGFGFGNPGNLSPPRGASTYSAGDAAGAAQVVVSTTQQHGASLSAIQAQLPSFYGGGGSGGLTAAVSISGSLPSGFTALAAGATPAVSAVVFDTPATTDSHTVSATWWVPDGEAKYLFLRGNSTLSTCVYAKIQSNDPVAGTANCELVAVVAGQSRVFTPFALPGSGALIAAQTYSVAAVGDVFTVSGPGGLNVVYTDSGGVSQVGAAYRYGGFGTDGWVRQVDEYTTAGSVSYVPPSWATSTDVADVVVLGAGGGGAGGAPFNTGGGGGAGGWASLGRTAFGSVTSGSAWTGTVGAGGYGGAQNGGYGPGAGAASTLTIPGVSTLTGAGGAAGVYPGNTTGASPGNISCDNALYMGGEAQYANGWGISPGGGGGGGLGFDAGAATNFPGGAGAPGAVWIAAIDTSVPGSIGGFSFFDNAPAGPQTASVATMDTTSSTTYGQLASTSGPEVTVTVGKSGMVLLMMDCYMAGESGVGVRNFMSVAMSGAANTVAASDTLAVAYSTSSYSGQGAGITRLLTGLTRGATTFTAQYRVTGSTCQFSNRNIAVVPL